MTARGPKWVWEVVMVVNKTNGEKGEFEHQVEHHLAHDITTVLHAAIKQDLEIVSIVRKVAVCEDHTLTVGP